MSNVKKSQFQLRLKSGSSSKLNISVRLVLEADLIVVLEAVPAAVFATLLIGVEDDIGTGSACGLTFPSSSATTITAFSIKCSIDVDSDVWVNNTGGLGNTVGRINTGNLVDSDVLGNTDCLDINGVWVNADALANIDGLLNTGNLLNDNVFDCGGGGGGRDTSFLAESTKPSYNFL